MVATCHSVGRVLTQSQASLYICRSCRHQLSRIGTSFRQHRFLSKNLTLATNSSSKSLWNDGSLNAQRSAIWFPKRQIRRQAGSPVAERGAQIEQVQETATIDKVAQDRYASHTRDEPDKYVPAESWEGLEYVGSSGNWRDTPAQPGDIFSSWLDAASHKATDRQQLISCLHQALAECLTCEQAGLNPETTSFLDLSEENSNIINAFASATISASQSDQQPQVKFATEAQAEEVVEFLTTINTAVFEPQPEPIVEDEALSDVSSGSAAIDEKTYETSIAQEHTQPSSGTELYYPVQDQSFLKMNLRMEDPLTFSVLKRFSQLSGHRIPDPILNATLSSDKSLGSLIERLDESVVQPKPTKVAEILMNRPGLNDQGNVLIFPRRETSVDREKEVGRWKVIEKELQERGLPVFGTVKAG